MLRRSMREASLEFRIPVFLKEHEHSKPTKHKHHNGLEGRCAYLSHVVSDFSETVADSSATKSVLNIVSSIVPGEGSG